MHGERDLFCSCFVNIDVTQVKEAYCIAQRERETRVAAEIVPFVCSGNLVSVTVTALK